MATKLHLLLACTLALQLSGCNSAIPTPVPTSPPEQPIKLDPADAHATLSIGRTVTHMPGHFTLTAAIPLSFGIHEDELEDRPMVAGEGAGTAALSGRAEGSGGGYDVSAEWPVEYVVQGLLTTGTGGCTITLDVEESLLLSREVILHAAGLDIPTVGGEDEFTSFPKLVFTEPFDPKVRMLGTVESVFTLDEVCMPAYLGCNEAWRPYPG